MKNILTLCILNLIMLAPLVRAESMMKPINDQGYGTLSGRIQSLSMYRDFETGGKGNGANSTLGVILGYTSPEVAGFDAGLAYNYSFQLANNNNWPILANDDINVLNEGWVRYNFGVMLGLTNTTVLAGRRMVNGEVFRADDFRQKSRSIETVKLDSSDIANTRFTLGQAVRMSNWIQAGDRADFNDFGDVFGTDDDTDGVTWGEVVNQSIQGLEIAFFDAYAYDVANLIGTRIKWNILEKTALLGYYRNETDVGDADSRHSDAYGLSLQQKLGNTTLEPGVFSVHGNTLRFQETTTGINHPLGALMEICSCPFNGGADTVFLKATAKISKTSIYMLYNYTWHSVEAFDGQELNLVVKQPVTENLTVAFKGGVGYRDWDDGSSNTTDSDVRLFMTYSF